jgi:hypothetical protein
MKRLLINLSFVVMPGLRERSAHKRMLALIKAYTR